VSREAIQALSGMDVADMPEALLPAGARESAEGNPEEARREFRA
jgi:hypothetical protein